MRGLPAVALHGCLDPGLKASGWWGGAESGSGAAVKECDMSALPEPRDIDDLPELVRLVEEVRNTQTPLVLRIGGEAVATIRPVAAKNDFAPGRPKSPEAIKSLLAAAGGWRGKVDVDQFLKDNAESRRISSRPPVEL